LYLVLDSAAFNNFLFFKCFLKNCARLRYIKITHRVLFSLIQRTPNTVYPMTLKIPSTHAFDTGIAIIIILHKFQQNWSKFIVEFNEISYPRHQAHRANHFEKIPVTKATSSIFQALRQEMVTLFEASRPKGLK